MAQSTLEALTARNKSGGAATGFAIRHERASIRAEEEASRPRGQGRGEDPASTVGRASGWQPTFW